MPIAITYARLKLLSPCEGRRDDAVATIDATRKWGRRKLSAAEAKACGVSFRDVIWVLSALARTDKDVERRVRLWAADCAARVLDIYEKTEPSIAPRNAIVAARQYARGEIGDAAAAAARDAAAAAARDAAWAAAWDAARAAWAAAAAARAAAWDASAAWAAAAAARAASAVEQAWQYERLVAWMSDREPEDWPLPVLPIKQAAE